ncbi:MAG: ammonium transporter [Clostridia bacterium]
MNYVDSLFVFICAILVFFMTPALAMFYGGMVRSKNVLNTNIHSYALYAIVSIQWIFIGYSLAFGGDMFGLVGGFNHMFMSGVLNDVGSVYAPQIPQSLFLMYQMAFAVITPALVSGSVAERIKFSSFLVFITAWCFLVYDPVAHWVWGTGGWLNQLGVKDFAGGYVVEILSGVSGLVAAVVLGKRKNIAHARPHQIPLSLFGAGVLIFGWYGFNAGSALAFNGVAINAFITTNTAAACGMIGWAAIEWIRTGKPTALGVVSGAVAAMVAITPCAGFVDAGGAFVIGLVAGVVCYFAVAKVKHHFGYDDTLDVFGVHGVGGTLGVIFLGLFATTNVNKSGVNGLLYGGGFDQLGKQLIGVVAVYVFAIVMTFVILKVVDKTMGLRATEEHEAIGLDVVAHGEKAYNDLML